MVAERCGIRTPLSGLLVDVLGARRRITSGDEVAAEVSSGRTSTVGLHLFDLHLFLRLIFIRAVLSGGVS